MYVLAYITHFGSCSSSHRIVIERKRVSCISFAVAAAATTATANDVVVVIIIVMYIYIYLYEHTQHTKMISIILEFSIFILYSCLLLLLHIHGLRASSFIIYIYIVE